jgi:anti-sigma regulatory factor (Ser/Thr protein kinase)
MGITTAHLIGKFAAMVKRLLTPETFFMVSDSVGTIGRADSADERCLMAVDFHLPEAVRYVAHLRKTVRCLCDGLNVSGQDSDEMETVIGELATNAIRHAHGGSYRVNLEFFGSRVVITVIDKGTGFDRNDSDSPGSPRLDSLAEDDSFRFGGFGLPLVYSIADRVAIEPNHPHGTIVRAECRLHPSLASESANYVCL